MLEHLRRLCFAVGIVLLAVPAARAQESRDDDIRRDDGFRVTSVTASATYFSQSVPQDLTIFEDVFLGSGEAMSGSIDLRWTRTRQKTRLFFGSVSTYGNRLQQTKNTNWSSDASNSWNEAASAEATRAFGHWRLNGYGFGSVMNFDEAMFQTSASSRVVGTASNFGTTAGTLLHPATPGAGGLQADATTVKFLFGRRVASAGGSGELVYARSPRFQMGFNGGMSQIRHLNDGTDVIGFDYPQATSAAAGGYVNYAPTRFTEMGFEGKALSTDTTFTTSTGGSGSFTFKKLARKHWFGSGSIGGGWTGGTSTFKSIIYSAGGGFSANAHTFFAYYNRDISQLYVPALGPDSAFFSTVNLSWFWSRPRSRWWSHATYFHYRDQPPAGVPAPTSWRMLETFGREMGRHFLLTGEYSIGKTGARRYIRNGKRFQLEEDGFRVSVSWFPRAFERRP